MNGVHPGVLGRQPHQAVRTAPAEAAPMSPATEKGNRTTDNAKAQAENELLLKAEKVRDVWEQLQHAFQEPLPEPPKGPRHWDYVLREMQWLAQDVAQERLAKASMASYFAGVIARGNVRLKPTPRGKQLRAECSRQKPAAGRSVPNRGLPANCAVDETSLFDTFPKAEAKASEDGFAGVMLTYPSEPGVFEKVYAELRSMEDAQVVAREERVLQIKQELAETLQGMETAPTASQLDLEPSPSVLDLGEEGLSMDLTEDGPGHVSVVHSSALAPADRRQLSRAQSQRTGTRRLHRPPGYLRREYDIGGADSPAAVAAPPGARSAAVEAWPTDDMDLDTPEEAGTRRSQRQKVRRTRVQQMPSGQDDEEYQPKGTIMRQVPGRMDVGHRRMPMTRQALNQQQRAPGLMDDQQLLLAIMSEFGDNWHLVADVYSITISLSGSCVTAKYLRQRAEQILSDQSLREQLMQMPKNLAREILLCHIPAPASLLQSLENHLYRAAHEWKKRMEEVKAAERQSRTMLSTHHGSHDKVHQTALQLSGGRVRTPHEILAEVNLNAATMAPPAAAPQQAPPPPQQQQQPQQQPQPQQATGLQLPQQPPGQLGMPVRSGSGLVEQPGGAATSNPLLQQQQQQQLQGQQMPGVEVHHHHSQHQQQQPPPPPPQQQQRRLPVSGLRSLDQGQQVPPQQPPQQLSGFPPNVAALAASHSNTSPAMTNSQMQLAAASQAAPSARPAVPSQQQPLHAAGLMGARPQQPQQALPGKQLASTVPMAQLQQGPQALQQAQPGQAGAGLLPQLHGTPLMLQQMRQQQLLQAQQQNILQMSQAASSTYPQVPPPQQQLSPVAPQQHLAAQQPNAPPPPQQQQQQQQQQQRQQQQQQMGLAGMSPQMPQASTTSIASAAMASSVNMPPFNPGMPFGMTSLQPQQQQQLRSGALGAGGALSPAGAMPGQVPSPGPPMPGSVSPGGVGLLPTGSMHASGHLAMAGPMRGVLPNMAATPSTLAAAPGAGMAPQVLGRSPQPNAGVGMPSSLPAGLAAAAAAAAVVPQASANPAAAAGAGPAGALGGLSPGAAGHLTGASHAAGMMADPLSHMQQQQQQQLPAAAHMQQQLPPR